MNVSNSFFCDEESCLDFFSGLGEGVFCLVFVCFRDDFRCLSFVDRLVEGVGVGFSGLKVTGFYHEGCFCNEGILVVCFDGVGERVVFDSLMDLRDVDGQSKRIADRLGDGGLCFVWSANHYRENNFLDKLLRRVCTYHPNLQLVGGVSAPDPLVFCNDGVVSDGVVFSFFPGFDFEYRQYCGYEPVSRDDVLVSKSDENYIYELDGKNAVSYYCDRKRIRPYVFNTITSLTVKKSMAHMVTKLAQTNKTLFDALIKGTIDVLGFNTKDFGWESLYFLRYEEDLSRITPVNHQSEGRKLRWVTSDEERQVRIVSSIGNDFSNRETLVFSCGYLPYLYSCRYDLIEKELMKKDNLTCVYVWGEIGSHPPHDEDKNVVHGGTIQVVSIE